MKYFTRNQYNRLQLSGQFPFANMEAVELFWSELYFSDYKINRDYYENQIREAMPEVLDNLYGGQEIYDKNGPAPALLEKLQEATNDWKKANESYKEHFDTIKEFLPEGVIDLCSRDLQESRIIDIGMPEEHSLVIELDTRFSNSSERGIDKLTLTFTDVKSIRSVGAIHLRSWLFEEVFFNTLGEFELRILLDDSELAIAAGDLKISVKTMADQLHVNI